MIHACAKQASATGTAIGLSQTSSAAAAMNGTTCPIV
jgi:hypothetical protein